MTYRAALHRALPTLCPSSSPPAVPDYSCVSPRPSASPLQVIPASRIAGEAALADVVDAAGVSDPHAVLPRAAALAADALYEAAVLGHASASASAAGDIDSSGAAPGVEVVAYAFDVLPACHVSLLVTNTGAAAPKQVRRLHDELYG